MSPTPLELKGLHLPEAISWWPPAIGWWLVVFATLAFLVFLVWFIKRLIRKTPVKQAKVVLQQIKNHQDWDNTQKMRELSALLRRVAISIYPRSQVASLSGMAWLALLDSPLRDSPFSNGIGKYFADAPYRQVQLSDSELLALFELCEHWLKYCTKPDRDFSKQPVTPS